jgi:hypothetical protein
MQLLFLGLSFFFFACHYRTDHGWQDSIFVWFYPVTWWIHFYSWKNKHEWFDNPVLKFITKYIITAFTDAWHLFQGLAFLCLFLAFRISTFEYWHIIYCGFIFLISYHIILVRHTYKFLIKR